jgi:cytochrome c oxidase cbb3-type subunit I
MWVAGIMEGLMWRAYDKFGFLQYSFVESVIAVHPFMVIRMLGGVFFLIGALIAVYNMIRTVTSPTTAQPLPNRAAPALASNLGVAGA